MKVTSTSFADGKRIPEEYAFCAPDPQSHVKLSANRNPQLEWGDLPMGTRSIAVVCHDCDVPSLPDDVNQEGRTIWASLPRIDFFHWVLIDLDPHSGPIREGDNLRRRNARGKPGPQAARGARQGMNDYTLWFADNRT